MVDTIILRKLFVFLFWIYYVERYQVVYEFERGDDLPEIILEELRGSLKQKYMKLYTLITPPKDDVLDLLPFFFTSAISLALPDIFAQIKSFDDYAGCLRLITKELTGYNPDKITIDKIINKHKRTE